MKVKTLKNIRFWLKCQSYQSEKKKQKVFKLVRGCQAITKKSPKATLTKFCSNKGYIIIITTGKFHSGLQCSSCFMFKL